MAPKSNNYNDKAFFKRLLLIWSFILCLVLLVSGQYDGSVCYEEIVRGSIFTGIPLADNDVMTVARCVDACPTLDPTYTHVGLTFGKTCLCGKLTSKLLDFKS
jgi:hypothetical protein